MILDWNDRGNVRLIAESGEDEARLRQFAREKNLVVNETYRQVGDGVVMMLFLDNAAPSVGFAPMGGLNIRGKE